MHEPGRVPQYYPMQTINKVINGMNSTSAHRLNTSIGGTRNTQLLENALHK